MKACGSDIIMLIQVWYRIETLIHLPLSIEKYMRVCFVVVIVLKKSLGCLHGSVG